ncbi:unnamed protein product [Rhizoctonia solani]|uniref:Uncharacterized protein n=1 Tax=Rhizoctonia solani TaxID=456999 RepID=A0A8H3DZL0_9AGAM|nr:unnamed protein product [Rhizoctonia solani]
MNTPTNIPLSLVVSLAVCWLAYKFIKSNFSPAHRLPGPDAAHWMWGHELIVNESPFDEAYTQWTDSFGPTYKIKGAMFHPDIIVTSDPEALDSILRKGVYSYSTHFSP